MRKKIFGFFKSFFNSLSRDSQSGVSWRKIKEKSKKFNRNSKGDELIFAVRSFDEPVIEVSPEKRSWDNTVKISQGKFNNIPDIPGARFEDYIVLKKDKERNKAYITPEDKISFEG